ncbi:MAG TPA: hypothetical protein VFU24_08575 [Burkholderiales bacterium]|nr:hypothetical protein [Vicinamibacterales bacterium]HEU5177495.1 hypothetical protein [Burkholderiales bacterium]
MNRVAGVAAEDHRQPGSRPDVLLYARAVPTINRGETIASVGVVGLAPK